MIVTESKKMSEHFHSDEFTCRCGCGQIKVDTDLIALLETIRAAWGEPMHVNSGYRCPDHNKAVKGATHSQHMIGTAADFTVKGVSNTDVWIVANKVNSDGGVGKYDSFTHVDVRGHRARW